MPDPTTVAQVALRWGPSVIGLRAGARGGSGAIVGPGTAVTLARNLRGNDVTIRIGGNDVAARVTGSDSTVDLAVLTFEPNGAPEPLEWAIGATVGIGTAVFALADPAGRGLRVTSGSVSASPGGMRGPGGRLIEGVIEHTAPLPRGSGGGPLLDDAGRIIGLNSIRRDEGLIVAWPASALQPRVEALLAGHATAPPRLGVELVGRRAARRMREAVGLEGLDGLLVAGVEPESPAARAGIARGDLITAAAGTAVSGPDALFEALEHAAGGELSLTVVRGNEELTLAARVSGPTGDV